ncbi:MAG: hypothetical protein R3E32_24845 [Chitinophagales bacterium]
MKHKQTILDIEPLLKEKSFEEMDMTERDFLFQHLGNESQIKQYQALLQCYSKATIINPKLRPKAAIQSHLRNKLEAQSVVRNGLESIFVAIASLFAVRSSMNSGIALAMLTLAFWFGSNMEQSLQNNFEYMQDSLAMAAFPDTAMYNQPLQNDSNTAIVMPKTFYHTTMLADSFTIRGILRQ